MGKSLDRLLDELEGEWDFEGPPSAAELKAAEKTVGGTLPEPLATFYRRADGATVGNVDLFTLDELADVNKRRGKKLASTLFFASDGADGFFALDLGNKMKKGREAVFWTDRGSSSTKGWIFVAADVASFLQLAATGETPWAAPSVGEIDIDAMTGAMAEHRDRWAGRGPAEPRATFDAGFRLNVRVPNELEALLEVADGFAIPSAGITVLSVADLAAVGEATNAATGRPGAIWFAHDGQGNRYAVTSIGWRDSEGGDVVRVGKGESPSTAPIIGTLPSVVVAWLEKGAKG